MCNFDIKFDNKFADQENMSLFDIDKRKKTMKMSNHPVIWYEIAKPVCELFEAEFSLIRRR